LATEKQLVEMNSTDVSSKPGKTKFTYKLKKIYVTKSTDILPKLADTVTVLPYDSGTR